MVHEVQRPIDELTELSRICDQVSMLVMDASAFEKFFGKIYAAVNLFQMQAHTPDESAQLVGSACQLLELAVEHHRNTDASATEGAVMVFERTDNEYRVGPMQYIDFINNSVQKHMFSTLKHAISGLKSAV